MLLFYLFSFVFSAKFTEYKGGDLDPILSKTEYNLLLLFSPNFRDGRNSPKILRNVAHKIDDQIAFIQCDITTNQEMKDKYHVVDSSLYLLFHKKDFITKYTGKYTPDDLFEFVSNALDGQDVFYPKTEQEIFHFQKKTPVNIIISSDKLSEKAEMIAHEYTQLIHVAVVTNQTLIEKLHLPPLLFNKPHEFLTIDYQEDCNIRDIVKNSQPTFDIVTNQNLLGRMSLCVLYDKNVPFHLNKINEVFKMTMKEDFGKRLRYTVIDFFDAPKFIEQFGVFRFSHPIFFVIGHSTSMWQICNEALLPSEEIFFWVRQAVTGKSKPSKNQLLPILYAQEFIPKVLPPNLDVILFVASPSMEYYKESKKNAETIAKIYEGVKNVKFYEFNSQTEHVQGLQLPASTTPIFSIWPAKDNSGKAFKANLPMNIMLDALFNILQANQSEEEKKMVNERAKPYLSQKEQ